jgi:hypothetical protein
MHGIEEDSVLSLIITTITILLLFIYHHEVIFGRLK